MTQTNEQLLQVVRDNTDDLSELADNWTNPDPYVNAIKDALAELEARINAYELQRGAISQLGDSFYSKVSCDGVLAVPADAWNEFCTLVNAAEGILCKTPAGEQE